ncbi:MAG: hypothetical protein QOE33_1402 [Acidobacteriota bacterium]|nr:hypothetical protein [Acidobacteriota bacterium]
MNQTHQTVQRITARIFTMLASALFAASFVAAQSGDLASPTPVFNNEISGRIAPLDVGDPRQTRHFYTFNARPGDLELTVEANNLDGEIDLFTANAMRPLAQVTLYSGLGSNVARTIFFRRDETVILRVQARSPNDSDGAYHIRLGGTFAASTLPQPEESARKIAHGPVASSEKPAEKGARRVNSIGARIEEPKSETPAPEHAEIKPTPNETTTPKPAPAKTPATRSSTARRTTTARRGATRGGSAAGTTSTNVESAKTEPAKTETKEPAPTSGEPAHTAANASRARANRTRNSRTNTAGAESRPAAKSSSSSSSEATSPANSAAPTATTATGLEAPGSRIVLELRDGTRIEREMSEVRRVAVEGRLVVIVFKNGRVERQPLANIQRMSIEP